MPGFCNVVPGPEFAGQDPFQPALELAKIVLVDHHTYFLMGAIKSLCLVFRSDHLIRFPYYCRLAGG